jgi:hypothetical protein
MCSKPLEMKIFLNPWTFRHGPLLLLENNAEAPEFRQEFKEG